MTHATHEQFVAAVRDAAIASGQLNDDERKLLAETKLVYGAGDSGLRGVTFFNRWRNGAEHSFVEVCAFGQESIVQLAGTTIHELGHVLAGPLAGHGKDWRQACARLGLRRAKAVGYEYRYVGFEPGLRETIYRLPKPDEGEPVNTFAGMGLGKLKPCNAGVGTRGGKSRGAGSGSRLRLYHCDCEPPIKARVSSDNFDATCNCCHGAFKLQGGDKHETPLSVSTLLATLIGASPN